MNPAIGSVAKFIRQSDGVEFNALVLSDEGPGFVGVAYVDTTASPAFVATATPVPVVTPNENGLVLV
jgi:hypothetical protein